MLSSALVGDDVASEAEDDSPFVRCWCDEGVVGGSMVMVGAGESSRERYVDHRSLFFWRVCTERGTLKGACLLKLKLC